MNYANFSHSAPFLDQVRSTADYMETDAAALAPLCRLPGFHKQTCMIDVMHAGPLGVCMYAAGSALIELCEEGHFGMHAGIGDWKSRLARQLTTAYQNFREYGREHRVVSSQPCFTVPRLSMVNKASWPMLKAKAWNCMCVIAWLAAVCAAAPVRNPHERDRAAMLWGFAHFHHLLRTCGMWMTDSELHELRRARDAMLQCYHSLSANAAIFNQSRYPIKPKHHMLSHAEHNAQLTRLNPGSHWCFAEEDNMGIMMRICASVHNSTMGTRALERWCMQFFWDLTS